MGTEGVFEGRETGGEVRPLGRDRGSVTPYPVGTGARLIRTLELAGPGRPNFEKLAWRVWWEDGGEFVPLVRDLLRREAAGWESELSRRQGNRPPSPRWKRPMRRHPRSACRREETELAFEKALGIDHARTDRLAGGEPWLEGSSAADLKQLSSAFGRRSLSDLADTTADALETARREVYVFFQIFEALASSIGAVLAGDALGLSTVAAVFGSRPEKLQPFLVLMWLALREDPVLHEGMLGTMAALPDALAARDAFEGIRVMRTEVPALAAVMTDEALGAALLDAARGERLRVEIAEVSSMNQGAVDRFFAEHPEFATTLEA